jgi:hypothetical protein
MAVVGKKSGDLICRMCASGEVENAEHFACRCSYFDAERQECLSRVRVLADGVHAPELQNSIAQRSVALLLGDTELGELPLQKQKEVDIAICDFLKVAWKKRRVAWRQHCVEGSEWRLK